MILTCPSCGTQYVVKDGSIPPQGRQVRCASCKHSWYQDPEASSEVEQQPEPAPTASISPAAPETDEGQQSVGEATLIEPRSGPEAEERAYEEVVVEEQRDEAIAEPVLDAAPGADEQASETTPPPVDWSGPPQAEAQDDEFSPFPTSDELEPSRRSVFLPLLLVLFAVAVIAAAFWFFAPGEWKARLGVGAAGSSPLALVTTHMDRQRLESGNELLTVTGRVINPTATSQPVPPLRAQLRSRTGKVVYSWTISPPAQSLAPGSSASFNSAEVNVPPGGDELTITLGEPRA